MAIKDPTFAPPLMQLLSSSPVLSGNNVIQAASIAGFPNDLNRYLAGDGTWQIAPGPFISTNISASQSITTAVATTVVLNKVENQSDPNKALSLNKATGVVTTQSPGWYLAVSFQTWTSSTGDRVNQVFQGANEIGRSYMPGGFLNVSCATVLPVAAGSAFSTTAFQNSGGALNLTGCRFVVSRILAARFGL